MGGWRREAEVKVEEGGRMGGGPDDIDQTLYHSAYAPPRGVEVIIGRVCILSQIISLNLSKRERTISISYRRTCMPCKSK